MTCRISADLFGWSFFFTGTGRGPVSLNDESAAGGFFEVPVSDHSTTLGFISGSFSKTSNSSSSSSKAGDSPKVLFFFADVRISI